MCGNFSADSIGSYTLYLLRIFSFSLLGPVQKLELHGNFLKYFLFPPRDKSWKRELDT